MSSCLRKLVPLPFVVSCPPASPTLGYETGDSVRGEPVEPPRSLAVRQAHRERNRTPLFLSSLSNRPAHLTWAAASLLLVGACAHVPPPPDALLTLQVRPAAAQVYVDEQPVGREAGGFRVPVRGGALYRVEVRAAGHFPAYREVVVPPRGNRELQIALRPDPDRESPSGSAVPDRESRSGSAVDDKERPALPTELRRGP